MVAGGANHRKHDKPFHRPPRMGRRIPAPRRCARCFSLFPVPMVVTTGYLPAPRPGRLICIVVPWVETTPTVTTRRANQPQNSIRQVRSPAFVPWPVPVPVFFHPFAMVEGVSKVWNLCCLFFPMSGNRRKPPFLPFFGFKQARFVAKMVKTGLMQCCITTMQCCINMMQCCIIVL